MANRHPTGWTSDANRALTLVSFRLPQEIVDLLAAAARAAGIPKRQALKQAIRLYAETVIRPYGGDPGDENRPPARRLKLVAGRTPK